MEQAERAFWLGIWRGFLAGLSFTIVSACYIRDVHGTLLGGAYVALIYSIFMWIDASRWRQDAARFSVLRFAQSGAALAIALCLCSQLI